MTVLIAVPVRGQITSIQDRNGLLPFVFPGDLDFGKITKFQLDVVWRKWLLDWDQGASQE